MNSQEPILDMHAEHNAWLAKLSFYKDELAIMQGRIEEIAGKNTSAEVLSKIDHFQNQLMIQRKQLSNIKHTIKKHEDILESSVLKNASATVSGSVGDHAQHGEQMARFEEIFSQLRKELMGFVAKTI